MNPYTIYPDHVCTLSRSLLLGYTHLVTYAVARVVGIRGYWIGPDGRLSPTSTPSGVYTAGLPNPSLVSSDPMGRFLFAIHETDDGAGVTFHPFI